jgi:WD40 repeat protein/transcriptional regulator with XRE-family HTH domain
MMSTDLPATDLFSRLNAIRSRREFADELTKLRERAGLTVREVARAVDVPDSTIGGYFGGAHLPALRPADQLTAILRACGVRDEEQLTLWSETLIRLRRAPGRRSEKAPVPFRGLESFQPADAEWFCGREDLTAIVRRRCLASPRHGGVLVVVGPSGSGKSSLLRAGLVPALQEGPLPGDDPEPGENQARGQRRREVVLFTPGPSPCSELAAQLGRVVGQDPELLVQIMDTDPARWWDMSGPEAAGDDPGLVLIIDQFEEIFTVCDSPNERDAFVTALCAGAESGRWLVVIGLRADFYPQALRLPPLIGALQDGQVVVGPMSAPELRRAITEPAHRAKVDIESGLVELLLADMAPASDDAAADAAHEPGGLPLLAHALRVTWERGNRRRLTVDAYRASGGIRGAVAHTAEQIYSDLTAGQQETARKIFMRLVQVSDDAADARRRVSPRELELDARDTRWVLDRFIGERLVTAGADHVEISHEALLPAWPRLRGWIDSDRAGLRTHRQLTWAAEAWREADRDPLAVYRGGRLAAAVEWAAETSHQAALNPLEREFLRASVDHDTYERRAVARRTRLLQRLLAAISVLLLVTGSLAGFAFWQRSVANQQRDVAVSRQVATLANQMRDHDVSLAMQLSLAAYRISPTPEARSSLLTSYGGPSATRALGPAGVMQNVAINGQATVMAGAGTGRSIRLWSMDAEGRPRFVGADLQGHGDTVYSLAFSPDGRTLASGSGDRTVRLWNVADPDHARQLGDPLAGAGNTVYSVAFSPDGHTLAAGSADNTVRLWNVSDPGHAQAIGAPLTGSTKAIQAVAFSPDGQTLAAGGADREVRLWDIRTLSAPRLIGAPLTGPVKTVFSVAFSPDGRTLAAGSADAQVWLWSLTGGTAVPTASQPLSGPRSWINGIGFSPDGGEIAAASSDSHIWIWDLNSHKVRVSLPQPGPVTSVVYSAGDLLSSGADGSARIWHLPGPTLGDYGQGIFSTTFSTRGHTVAVTSADNTGRLFDVADPRHPRLLGPAMTNLTATSERASGASVLSPDGHTLAAGGVEGSVQLWDVSDPAHPQALPHLAWHTANIEAMSFSPDGRILAIGGDDRKASLWDVSDPRHPIRFDGPPVTADNYVFSPTFSPDGRLLAIGGADNTIAIWDVSHPDRPVRLGPPLTGPSSYVYSVQFSPDGRVLAAGSADNLIRQWDVTDPAHPRPIGQPLTGPTNYVYAIAFSPDGRTLAAAGGDGTVWLWDDADPRHAETLGAIQAHAGQVFIVAFDPVRNLLATGGSDQTARLWLTNAEDVARYVCSVSGDPITAAEWTTYVRGMPYNPPC